jgi:hypothetical protein
MRRFRIAGSAFGLLLLPACAGMKKETTARPTYLVPINYPPAAQPVAPAAPAATTTVPPTNDFAVQRTPPLPIDADPLPSTRTVSMPPARTEPSETPIARENTPNILPIRGDGPSIDVPTRNTSAPTTPEKPPASECLPLVTPVPTVPAPASNTPTPNHRDLISPPAESDGIIRPSWPTIPGFPSSEGTKPPSNDPGSVVLPTTPLGTPSALLAPPQETTAPPVPTSPAPDIVPTTPPPSPVTPAIPPTTSFSPNKIATPAVPVEKPAPTTPPVVEKVAVPEKPPVKEEPESTLLKTLRAFERKHPDEAIEHLKATDPLNQQILLALIPPLVQISDSKLDAMRPDEIDRMLSPLERVHGLLRTKASLHIRNASLCRDVHGFAKISRFNARHEYRPGDVVYLYLEMANFSCVPQPNGEYAVNLATYLEWRDSAGNLVTQHQPKSEPDIVSSQPHDYYRAYRFGVPASTPAGTCTLGIRVVDLPTGREARKTVDFRVSTK